MDRVSPFAGEPRAEAAARLALQGGTVARDRFQHTPACRKDDESAVTQVDLTIQRRLGTRIAEEFPDDRIAGEESAGRRRRRQAEYCWVLDPLDGPHNFVRGIPGFAVSVGVLRGGNPYAGAVCDPICGWLFTACVGHGAFLNGQPLRLQPTPPSGRSLFSIRLPLEGALPPFMEKWLGRYRLRLFGSTALHLCYVALGALAFVHDPRAALWGVAGAASVVLESGGVLTGLDGSPLFPLSPAEDPERAMAFLAGDPLGHRQALEDVRASIAHDRP